MAAQVTSNDTRSVSNSDPPLSIESIIAIVAIIVTIMLFLLGFLSRHQLKRFILCCLRRTPTCHMGQEDVELAPALDYPDVVDWEEWRRYQQEHVQIFHIIATRTMHARAWGAVTGTATMR